MSIQTDKSEEQKLAESACTGKGILPYIEYSDINGLLIPNPKWFDCISQEKNNASTSTTPKLNIFEKLGNFIDAGGANMITQTINDITNQAKTVSVSDQGITLTPPVVQGNIPVVTQKPNNTGLIVILAILIVLIVGFIVISIIKRPAKV